MDNFENGMELAELIERRRKDLQDLELMSDVAIDFLESRGAGRARVLNEKLKAAAGSLESARSDLFAAELYEKLGLPAKEDINSIRQRLASAEEQYEAAKDCLESYLRSLI